MKVVLVSLRHVLGQEGQVLVPNPVHGSEIPGNLSETSDAFRDN